MNDDFQESSGPGFNLSLVYYVLFRHKWKILASTVVGLAAAATIYFKNKPPFISVADLYIGYVTESRGLLAGNSDTVKQTDTRAESVIGTEVQIMASLDLAREVAELMTPDVVLPKGYTPRDIGSAAAFIRRNLQVSPPRVGNVVRLTMQHPEGQKAPEILAKVIQAYNRKHKKVHQGEMVSDEWLDSQVVEAKSAYDSLAADLNRLRRKVQAVTPNEARTQIWRDIVGIRTQISDIEGDLAQRVTALKMIENLRTTSSTNAPSTNEVQTALAPAAPEVPREKIVEYNSLVQELEFHQQSRIQLQMNQTTNSPRVKVLIAKIKELDDRRVALETNHPGLVKSSNLERPRVTATPNALGGINAIDPGVERAQIAANFAKLQFLTNQEAQLRVSLNQISDVDVDFLDTQRRFEQADAKLKSLQTKKDQRILEKINAETVNNIYAIQTPTPPQQDYSEVKKPILIALASGLGIGLGLALLLEFLLRNSFRNATEAKDELKLPLFVAMPDAGPNFAKALDPNSRLKQLPGPGQTTGGSQDTGFFRRESGLQPYYEALRDQLIGHFEAENLTRTPKLVALTSSSHGVGVSTTAAGLAASLSDTKDGKVLLVDMKGGNGAAHPFMQGKRTLPIGQVLEKEKREDAMVEDNLYIATDAGDEANLPKTIPRRFQHLVPKFKASDYDYIIFDLPPVTQTSLTQRLAGFMDIVLFVAEPEKTETKAAKSAVEALKKANSHVALVVNRRKEYLPKKLRSGDL